MEGSSARASAAAAAGADTRGVMLQNQQKLAERGEKLRWVAGRGGGAGAGVGEQSGEGVRSGLAPAAC
jgi:hypothetical protein